MSTLSAIVGLILMALSTIFTAIPVFLVGLVIYNVFISYAGDGAEWLFVILIWFSPLVLGGFITGICMFFYGVYAIILAIAILVVTLIIIKEIGSKRKTEEENIQEWCRGFD